jgi:CubicO group peptidase (beta-lactamase class C family)
VSTHHATRRMSAAVFVTIALAAVPTYAQRTMGAYHDVRELPDTPAGQRLREIIAIINANDAERSAAYLTEHLAADFRAMMPMDEHVALLGRVHDTTGGVEFYSVRRYEQARPENEITGIVRPRLLCAWRGIILAVEPEPPHRIARLMFAPARPPSDQPEAGPLTEAAAIKELEGFLERVAELDLFSGAVLVAKRDEVLLRAAYGPASRRFNVPNKVDTKFNLGSMNKMFTAVAIAQLQERGKLDWDDPVAKYLDEGWLDPADADRITIRHLLTHTSGLGSYFSDAFVDGSKARFRVMQDYRPLVRGDRPAFEPGSRWSYSNTGFLLLGLVVEKASGASYDEYVRKHICNVADMPNTGCYEMDHPVPNLAIGYSRSDNADGTHWENNLFKHAIKGGSAGGGFSTVDDLFHFAQALRADRLIRPETREVLWTATPRSMADGAPYGLGFAIMGPAGDRIVGHTGGFPGISAKLALHLDTGYTVAILSNVDGGMQVVDEKLIELFTRIRETDHSAE